MAKRGAHGEPICGHCGSTKMEFVRSEIRGSGGTVERTYYKCLDCNQTDYVDSSTGS